MENEKRKHNEVKYNYICFCCEKHFTSGYKGSGDLYCSECKTELTKDLNFIWNDTKDKSFQSEKEVKHKIYNSIINKEINIIVGPLKVTAPDLDTIYYHYVKKIYKIHCENCQKDFFSLGCLNSCINCGNKIYSIPKTRWVISEDPYGNLNDNLPIIKYMPTNMVLTDYQLVDISTKSYYMSEILLIYLKKHKLFFHEPFMYIKDKDEHSILKVELNQDKNSGRFGFMVHKVTSNKQLKNVDSLPTITSSGSLESMSLSPMTISNSNNSLTTMEDSPLLVSRKKYRTEAVYKKEGPNYF